MMTFIADGLCGRGPKGFGKFAKVRDEHLSLLIHYLRHDVVCEVRAQQTLLAKEVSETMKLPKSAYIKLTHTQKEVIRERQALLKWVGKSLEQAYDCAADLLKNTIASGKPSAIQRSYFEWQKISKQPEKIKRFHLLSQNVLKLLDISLDFPPLPVSKLVPLHDLTP